MYLNKALLFWAATYARSAAWAAHWVVLARWLLLRLKADGFGKGFLPAAKTLIVRCENLYETRHARDARWNMVSQMKRG